MIKIRNKFMFYYFIRCYFSSLWRLGFNPRPAQVGFMVDKVALEQVFLPVLQFPSISIIPPMLCACLWIVLFIHSFITSVV